MKKRLVAGLLSLSMAAVLLVDAEAAQRKKMMQKQTRRQLP